MNKRSLSLISLLTIALLPACASLESVSLTQIPEKRDKLVTASAHDYVFLGLTSQNDFVDEAINKLKSQCRNGKLSGVLTKHQTTAYVLVFKREVIANGYCDQAEA